ncbi:response regulator transcription factor [Cellulomonas hominis]
MTARRARVLVVEDDLAIAHLIEQYLGHEGFRVEVAQDGERGVELARETGPDVILLDLMLPGIDGLEVCRQVRSFSDAYVLMLTARGDEIDRVIGLSVGADDYVVKPFSPRELSARVQALLRRPRRSHEPGEPPDGRAPRRFGELVVDAEAREVSVAGRPVELTRTEFDVLEVLSARPRTVFERRRLLARVWGEDWVGDDHVIDVHVANLRRKLGDDAAASRFVRTVRGVGYRMGEGR